MARLLSIWFGAGLLRPAPGTWGSAVAIALGLLIYRIGHFPLLALAAAEMDRRIRWSLTETGAEIAF